MTKLVTTLCFLTLTLVRGGQIKLEAQQCAADDLNCKQELDMDSEIMKLHFQALYNEFREDKDIRALMEVKEQREMIEFWLDFLNNTDVKIVEKILSPNPKMTPEEEEALVDNLEKHPPKLQLLRQHVSENPSLATDKNQEVLDRMKEAKEVLQFFDIGNTVMAILRNLEMIKRLETVLGPDLDVVELERFVNAVEDKATGEDHSKEDDQVQGERRKEEEEAKEEREADEDLAESKEEELEKRVEALEDEAELLEKTIEDQEKKDEMFIDLEKKFFKEMEEEIAEKKHEKDESRIVERSAVPEAAAEAEAEAEDGPSIVERSVGEFAEAEAEAEAESFAEPEQS